MQQIAPILVVFGTRLEVIKFAPVVRARKLDQRLRVFCVSTGQQADLLPEFVDEFDLTVDKSLDLMVAEQSLNQLLAKLIESLDQVIEQYSPAAVIVQGDTTTALAAALSARYRAVSVMHVEAGLRTGNFHCPFPEESNRKLITHLSALHFAPTQGNVDTLLSEGVQPSDIVLTGNPIVDALQPLVDTARPSVEFGKFLDGLKDMKIIALTAHRRENIGDRLNGYLETIKQFIARKPNNVLVVPVHPNPEVQRDVRSKLGNTQRIKLIAPLNYIDFFCLLQRAWLVLSDSGGIQEEIITIGKPLLILREQTERPEAIESGCARLARTPEELEAELQTAAQPGSWCEQISPGINPFGDGNSGPRIAQAISAFVFSAKNNP